MLTPFEADNLSLLPGIRHGFFTRQGGTSRGLYASLNCGQGSADDRVAVTENRTRVARHLGAFADDVQTVHQVHSADALIVDKLTPRDELAKADALVTKVRGLAVGILTADCGPLLLADPQAGVVGAAHAGWRGAFGGIAEATVAAMEKLGAERRRVHAALGPCISLKNYEVGSEFVADFVSRDAGNGRYFETPKGKAKPHFDLPAFIRDRLNGLGLHSVEILAPCTYANESLFYSYRRSTHRSEPDYGRQISAIVVA